MKKKIDVSVVVCTYNRSKMLSKALESLLKQKTDGEFSYEIVVIDDSSTDNTKQAVKKVMKKSGIPMKYVLHKGKNSIPIARNRGIEESSGGWIAFFDDDQIADKNWLKELYLFASERKIMCVGGSVALFLSKEELSKISPTCRIILGENLDKNISRYGRKAHLFTPSTSLGTGNLLIKKDIFGIIGKFDESLASGGEDTDFLTRASIAGIEIWYNPRSIVHHIIPSHRLRESYFRWYSLRAGKCSAMKDCKELGVLKTLIICIVRIGKNLMVNIPILALSSISNENSEAIGQKCMIWRTEGYFNFVLHAIAPKLFSQAKFFNSIDFRKGRQIFENLGQHRNNKQNL